MSMSMSLTLNQFLRIIESNLDVYVIDHVYGIDISLQILA